jgi:hypothetical protein
LPRLGRGRRIGRREIEIPTDCIICDGTQHGYNHENEWLSLERKCNNQNGNAHGGNIEERAYEA